MGNGKITTCTVVRQLAFAITIAGKFHIPILSRFFRLSGCCPRNAYGSSAARAFDNFHGGTIQIIPCSLRHKYPAVLSRLGNLIAEMVVDRRVDRSPWHSSIPSISKTPAHAILEIIARIEHEGMPDHENVCSN